VTHWSMQTETIFMTVIVRNRTASFYLFGVLSFENDVPLFLGPHFVNRQCKETQKRKAKKMKRKKKKTILKINEIICGH